MLQGMIVSSNEIGDGSRLKYVPHACIEDHRGGTTKSEPAIKRLDFPALKPDCFALEERSDTVSIKMPRIYEVGERKRE